MVEGKHLNHPELEEGKRFRMKIFRVNANKDLPIKTIKTILQKAIDLYKTGTIKFKEWQAWKHITGHSWTPPLSI